MAAVMLSACGGEGEPTAASAEKAPAELGNVSSVVELRDALVDAGYDCAEWEQSNAVSLAAESGSCDDSSVLTTFASAGDLQQQLDREKSNESLLVDAGIDPTPILVGPNWMVKAPLAGDYAGDLGGTVVSGPSS